MTRKRIIFEQAEDTPRGLRVGECWMSWDGTFRPVTPMLAGCIVAIPYTRSEQTFDPFEGP